MGWVRPGFNSQYPDTMQREVQTSAGAFSFMLTRSARAKHLTIRVHAGGEIVVTAPARVSDRAVEDFFKERARRIARAWSYLSRQPKPIALPPAMPAERRALEEKLAPEVARAARLLAITVPPFTVRTMRSRFGSCSARGALSFSDSLRALPDNLFEYIVMHEAAHCVEHNHSPAFWAIVEKLIPDWRARRAALRQYSFIHSHPSCI